MLVISAKINVDISFKYFLAGVMQIDFSLLNTWYAAIKVPLCNAVQEGDATMMPIASFARTNILLLVYFNHTAHYFIFISGICFKINAAITGVAVANIFYGCTADYLI